MLRRIAWLVVPLLAVMIWLVIGRRIRNEGASKTRPERSASEHRTLEAVVNAALPAASRPKQLPGGQIVRLLNKATGKTIALGPSEYPNGAKLILGSDNDNGSRWVVESYPPDPATAPGARGYLRFKNADNGHYAGVQNLLHETGWPLATWHEPGPAETWRNIPTGDGWLNLVNRSTSKLMSAVNGSIVAQWNQNGSDEEKWQLLTDEWVAVEDAPWWQCKALCMTCDERSCSHGSGISSLAQTKVDAYRRLQDDCAAKTKGRYELRINFRDATATAVMDSPQVCE